MLGFGSEYLEEDGFWLPPGVPKIKRIRPNPFNDKEMGIYLPGIPEFDLEGVEVAPVYRKRWWANEHER